MAIFIPKENTYETKVEKVRDNLIDRIEVGAVNPSTPLKIGEIVANFNETNLQHSLENSVSVEDTQVYTRNNGGVYTLEVACSYLKIIPYYSEIMFQFEQKTIEGYIDKIFTAENDIGIVSSCQIKQSSATGYEATLTYSKGTVEVSEITRGNTSVISKQNNSLRNTINFEHSYKFTSYPDADQSFGENVTIKGNIENKFNNLEQPILNVTSSLESGVYTLNIKIFSKYERIELGGVTHSKYGNNTDTVKVPLKGQGTIGEIVSVEFTFKGNKYVLNLEEQTIKIASEKNLNKTQSIEGNELMQTTNYLLNSGEKAIEKAFTDTLNEYINGKETITLRCSVNDYYTETGYKEISKTTKKERQDYIDIYTYADINYDATKDYTALNTGIYADENTEFEIAFNNNLTYSNTSGYGSIFGARQGSQKNEINLSTFIQNDNTPYGVFRIGNKTYSAMLKDKGSGSVDIIVSFKDSVYKVLAAYGTTYETMYEIEIDKSPFKTPVPIYMFALNNNGEIEQFIENLDNFKYFKIWQNGELVRHFVPCDATVSEMRSGLYDFVEKKYYKQLNCRVRRPSGYVDTNEEIVDKKMLFAVGDEVIPIPIKSNDSIDGKYKFIEYLESKGGSNYEEDLTPYINTGIPADNNIKIEAKFQATNRLSQNYIFGARSDGNSDIINLVASGSGQWYIRYGKSSIDTLPTNDYNVHTVEMSNEGVYFDNQYLYKPSSDKFMAKNIYIFGVNEKGTLKRGSCRIYSFKIYQDGVLVRDFKPCYRYADQKLGMFDMVENKFYENASTDGSEFKSPFKKYRVNGRKISGQGVIWQTLSLQEV